MFEKQLFGKRIVLRPVEESDSELIVRWRNTPIIHACFYSDDVVTIESHKRWYDKNIANDPWQRLWMIDRIEDKVSVGMTGLMNIDLYNRNVEHGRVITDLQYRLEGYAFESIYVVLRYCFEELNMHKVYACILDTNIASQKFHAKLGFEPEAVFKEQIFKGGIFHDVIRMKYMKNSFRANESSLRKLCKMD
jgi:UDP-4-amino-4,6-dideoxy-N-acetyl-beta-L-altrosamine N-acetyltransferase